MSLVPPENNEDVMRMFQEVWSSSICQVLKKVSGEEFESRVLDSNPISGKEEPAGVWTLFSASARFTGEIGFFVSASDAKLLSSLLTGGVPDDAAVQSDDLRNTVAEFFRRTRSGGFARSQG